MTRLHRATDIVDKSQEIVLESEHGGSYQVCHVYRQQASPGKARGDKYRLSIHVCKKPRSAFHKRPRANLAPQRQFVRFNAYEEARK